MPGTKWVCKCGHTETTPLPATQVWCTACKDRGRMKAMSPQDGK